MLLFYVSALAAIGALMSAHERAFWVCGSLTETDLAEFVANQTPICLSAKPDSLFCDVMISTSSQSK